MLLKCENSKAVVLKNISCCSLLTAVFLVGCASSTGVVSKGNNAYYITIRSPQLSFGPPVSQKAETYKEASEFCSSKDLDFEQIDIKETNQIFGRHGSAELTFRCVSKK